MRRPARRAPGRTESSPRRTSIRRSGPAHRGALSPATPARADRASARVRSWSPRAARPSRRLPRAPTRRTAVRPRSAAREGLRQSPYARRACHLALVFTATLISTLVVLLFPFCERERNLRFPARIEEQLERYERQALALHAADHPANLLLVKEQLARTRGIMVELITLLVRRDVQVQQEHFAIPYCRVSIGEVGLALPK